MRSPLRFFALCSLSFGTAAFPAAAQTPPQKLTRADAEAAALRNQPQLQGALFRAQASKQVVGEVRSAYYPLAYGSLSGAEAIQNSRIGAGGLNNPSVFSRYANGVTVSQLVTDFGRTGNLEKTALLQAQSQEQNAKVTRADVLLRVDVAYYRALRAIAVQRVAEETLKARQLVTDQVTLLAQNNLKSGLDVSFANVNLSEAKLLAAQARSDVDAAFAELSAAMGYPNSHNFELADDSLPPPPQTDPAPLIEQALRERPDVAAQRFSRDSFRAFARAERDLWFPTVTAVGSAGLIPAGESPLASRWAAAGFNVTIPIFNGLLFHSRHAEANYRAQAADADERATEEQVSRDVRMAWLNANTAYQRVGLTGELLAHATEALNLAQARYNLGLSSIIELSQAQLNVTQAELQQAAAKYEYQMGVAALNYQRGVLR
jgi:outer membrane protein